MFADDQTKEVDIEPEEVKPITAGKRSALPVVLKKKN